ncbi:MAG: GntR family transcriptional regulator [Alphaproteobacteria bacterium]|nr:GntR family transcriptional regulator [Alphaproteobacteria bacterium]
MPKDATFNEEDVCNAIRDRVLEQRLAPGTKLTEESLCSIFGVGRTTVRRAFLLLTRDNIIQLQKNKGAVVASPSPEEAKQVFEARMVLERAMLEKAAQNVSTDDIARLREHLEEEADAIAQTDIARWIRLTGKFHILLAELSGNALMCNFLEQLVFQTSLIIALYGRSGAAPNCKGGDHARIVDAIAAGDATTAGTILVSHLTSIEGQLVFEARNSEQDLHAIFGT